MRALTLIADFTDAPPCGTACGLCVGHFCRAEGWLGEIPICRPCGEGNLCAQALAVKKAQSRIDASDLPRAPVRDERRCTDCKGLLGDQTRGPMCWPCKKRASESEKRATYAAERAAALAIGKAT